MMTVRTLLGLTVAASLLAGCATTPAADPRAAAAEWSAPRAVADVAERTLKLTLEAGTYEDGYVDAYYGPAALQAAAQAAPRPRTALIAEADGLAGTVDALLSTVDARTAADAPATPYSETRRLIALRGTLLAAHTRLRMIGGEKLAFADEARGLFGVDVTTRPLTDFDPILARLDQLVPGAGPLAARVDAFRDRYLIPADRLRPVFDAAIAECRRRTAQHIALPPGESFTMEFVTGKTWSGYNYYQGNYRSLIQINTDLPIRIDRAVDLGCHEGYPGHHVLNLLVEQRMARGGATGTPWREYLVNPLYSPTSVLSEGSANYGIELAFPGAEKLAFERDTLYPLAGLDPASAAAYGRVQAATEALGGARLTIAQLYLDGRIDRAEALRLSQRYLLLSPARAEQSVAFTDHYRSYVLNYGWGRDLVRAFVERGGPDAATRWQRMESLLAEPTVPADLRPG